ncbi:hypothetical protein ABE488_00875 [Luteimonas sp. TWI662]|uniref:hypothetical protein n=1 Tax=Luteimonas sp. TWI662 TaxID=3136789 RepID=UPI003207E742
MSGQQIRMGAGGTLTLTEEQARALRYAVSDALRENAEDAADEDADDELRHEARVQVRHLSALLVMLGWQQCAVDELAKGAADGR